MEKSARRNIDVKVASIKDLLERVRSGDVDPASASVVASTSHPTDDAAFDAFASL